VPAGSAAESHELPVWFAPVTAAGQPVEPPEAVQLAAFADVQVRVDLPFGETLVGFAERVTVGVPAAQMLPFQEEPATHDAVGKTLARTVAPSRA